MKENISITVPMEYTALKRASEMLYALGQDVMHTEHDEKYGSAKDEVLTGPAVIPEGVSGETPAPTPVSTPEAAEELDAVATEVFAQPVVTPTPEDALDHLANTPAPEAGAEVDINGIPWDTRIHASTKTKTVGGAWKNKRGVDKDLVLQITNELKAIMAVPTPEAVVTPAPVVVPTPEAVVTPAPTPVPSAPETPAAPGNITTFPDLAKAITTNKIEPQVVAGVMQVVGLASFPLLATRPELIPDVAQRLGL